MGKTSKRTKAKKKDFNKVKLKVGKHKPKADNVTDVTFKSQSIYIPEQLKQSQGEILTHRKKGWADLLTEVNHPSATIRAQSLAGMKELVSLEATKVEHSKVFEKILKLLLDEESAVRKQCFGVLAFLFTTMSETQMKPHFSLVLSHIFCAISHIDASIQKDSLQVVDLCLDHFAELISNQDCSRIIENFIDLISVKQGVKGHRSLVMNLSKKETSLTFRVRVLSRLEKMLNILLNVNKFNPSPNKIEVPCERWPTTNVGDRLLTRVFMPGLMLRDFDVSVASGRPSVPLQDLLKSVVPLLVQCWVEIWVEGTAQRETDDKQVKILMDCVVTILHQICSASTVSELEQGKLVSWVRQTYMPSLRKYIFNNFPFEDSVVDNLSAKRRKKNIADTGDMMSINLTTCNLASTLLSKQNDENLSDEDVLLLNKTTKFIIYLLNQTIRSPQLLNPYLFDKILDFVKNLDENTAQESLKEVFQALTSLFKSLPLRSILKARLTNFLSKLYASASTNRVLYFEEILTNLPGQLHTALMEVINHKKIFCQISDSATSNNLESILLFTRLALCRKNPTYLQNLHKAQLPLLETLEQHSYSIFCEEVCQACCQLQTEIIENIVPHLKELSDKHLGNLLGICANSSFTASNVCYVVDIMTMQLENQTKPMSNAEKIHLIVFLADVIFGKSEKAVTQCSVEDLDRHESICQHIVHCFNQLCNESEKLKLILTSVAQKRLKDVTSISHKAWVGILHLIRTLHCDEHSTSNFQEILNQMPSTVTSFSKFVLDEFLFDHFTNALSKS